MTTSRFAKLLVLLAGAGTASGGVPPALQATPAGGPAGVAAGTQDGPPQTQFIFNDIMDFSGSASDLFVWGWLPTISGEISDNGFFGGQKVDIAASATIGGDAFVFAQTGRISGHIGGDLYAFVADLTLEEGGRIDGAVHGSSGAFTIDGEIGGPVKFAGGAIVVNGTIRGDAAFEVGELELGPDAVIEGSLSYESPREATIDPGALVAGEIRYRVQRADEDEEDGEESRGTMLGWLSFWGLVWDCLWLISSFLVGSIALAVGGEVARRPADRLGSQPALGLGFGFVVAVVFPAAAILAMILIVTIPLGLISLALYVAAAYLARLVAAQAVGGWILAVIRGGKKASVYASLAVGLLILYFVMKIPYVGFLIWMAAIVAGLGGIFLATRKAELDDAGASSSPVMTA